MKDRLEKTRRTLTEKTNLIPDIKTVAKKLLHPDGRFDSAGTKKGPFPPEYRSVGRLIKLARSLLFPGYFDNPGHASFGESDLSGLLADFYRLLSDQILLSLGHGCFRDRQPCLNCRSQSYTIATKFVQNMPCLKAILSKDARATLEGDPACKSEEEVIISYPGFLAILVYRVAHWIKDHDVPLLPRMMTEYAHSMTGIDIHPGAMIGQSLCIDHGTGVVIGETTEIGDRVKIYQGVTLGALSIPRETVDSLRDSKRHPTIEDEVIIYANATILGGKTVIGARSIIGGNVWITGSVPPDTRVLLKAPELIVMGNH
jgi:serine O-acetyltransferase